MRFSLLKTVAAIGISLGLFHSLASAQCQRGGGGQSPGGTGNLTSTTTGYSQFPLSNAYAQNGLNPFAYNNSPMALAVASEQASRYARDFAAMQVQARSMAIQNQIAQAKAMRKQIDKASAAMRKAAVKEREEALAMREEREAARRAKNLEAAERGVEKNSVQLVSTQ